MSWFYLALLAPLLYGITNLLDDNLLQFVFENPYVASGIAGIFGAFPLISLLFLHAAPVTLKIGYLAGLSGLLTAIYFCFYFRALQVEQPSVVVALFSLVPATLPFLARIFLHENLNHLEIIGVVIVIISSFLLAAIDIKKFKFSAALLPVIGAVISVDIISLLTKYVYQNTTFYTGFMYFSFGLAVGGICFLYFAIFSRKKKRSKMPRFTVVKAIPIIVLEGLFGLGADFILNLAISRGPVSLVKAIEATQPILVLLIAILLYPLAPRLFREGREKGVVKKLVFILLGVVGVVVISIAAKV